MNENPMQIIMQMLNGGFSPQNIIQNIMQSNPQMQVVLNQMKSSGMSNEQFVRQYAKQHNIDINPYINMFKQNGVKF